MQQGGKKVMIQKQFYENLEQILNHIPQYNMKILLGDFNAEWGRKDIFKPTIGNDSLHQDS
jgi:endonuclease/exonuclease/phosphatase family metal-dependent hydrolase